MAGIFKIGAPKKEQSNRLDDVNDIVPGMVLDDLAYLKKLTESFYRHTYSNASQRNSSRGKNFPNTKLFSSQGVSSEQTDLDVPSVSSGIRTVF